MSDELVWTTGGEQARTFHDTPDDGRRTVCGMFAGERMFDGIPKRVGQMLSRADAEAAGLTECRRCFGHAERRKPIIEGRPNRG